MPSGFSCYSGAVGLLVPAAAAAARFSVLFRIIFLCLDAESIICPRGLLQPCISCSRDSRSTHQLQPSINSSSGPPARRVIHTPKICLKYSLIFTGHSFPEQFLKHDQKCRAIEQHYGTVGITCLKSIVSIGNIHIHINIHIFCKQMSKTQTQTQPQYSMPHDRRRVVTPLTRDQNKIQIHICTITLQSLRTRRKQYN